ncbi:hypothetical protein [Mycobacterium sp. 360MFTsu5.1]|uniref:hypothetical protein n=1 Tax=Mycobacterium sp. 360MFTsu5.1 TaxID=1172186 RepID=UPI00036DBF5B|nr:hypothetical protein [Mycobacterium sp. 360MFTsu5.1]
MHTPKELMFAIGLESAIVAAGCEDAVTLVAGKTVSADGAAPKVHCSIAPFTTTWPAMEADFTLASAAPESPKSLRGNLDCMPKTAGTLDKPIPPQST